MTSSAARRAGALLGALLLCLLAVGFRLAYVQGIHSEQYAEAARRQRVRRIELPAPRGAIYDERGAELAISVPARTVYANPRQVTDAAAAAGALSPLLHRPAAQIASDLRKDAGFVYLERRIGLVTADKIRELRLPGIGVLDEARRLYPGGTLGANLVGFIGTDQKGLSGLEYSYEELLSGDPGYRVLEQDPRGRRIPQGVFTELLPVPGSDLLLTIDADIQFAAERALGAALERTKAKGGMAVALDPRTGEIFAMASVPTYDPNQVDGIDDLSATRNRVVADTFEPGSVNKIVTAAAALTEGVIGPTATIWVPERMVIGGKEFKEKLHARSLDLRRILAQSSNLGTISLARKLGPERLDSYFERFGYGRTTGLGLPGESAGSLPSAGRWATSLPTMAIGQGLSVTTLQLARVYATIANDGVAVEPRLVSGWIDQRGASHEASESRKKRVVDSVVAQTLRDMLTSVVTEGTGKLAAVPGYAVAGKTGTAQKAVLGVGYRGHVATFVGMLPAARPEIVIAITLDDPVPVEGGLVSAPVFAEVARVAVRVRHIAPTPPAPQPQRLRTSGGQGAGAVDG